MVELNLSQYDVLAVQEYNADLQVLIQAAEREEVNPEWIAAWSLNPEYLSDEEAELPNLHEYLNCVRLNSGCHVQIDLTPSPRVPGHAACSVTEHRV